MSERANSILSVVLFWIKLNEKNIKKLIYLPLQNLASGMHFFFQEKRILNEYFHYIVFERNPHIHVENK